MNATDTRSQLLAEIAARPDDDTLRLAFADWLDEQPTTKTCLACKGDGRLDADHRPGTVECRMCWGAGTVADTADRDRAEFIRVQCRIAAWGCTFGAKGWDHRCGTDDNGFWHCNVRFRAETIIEAHPEWSRCRCPRMADRQWGPSDPRGCSPTCPTCGGTGDLFVSPGVSGASKPRIVTFARGFPDAVTCTLAEAFGTDGTPTPWAVEVVRQTPVVRFGMTDRVPDRDRADRRPVWFSADHVSDALGGPRNVPAAVLAEMTGYDEVACPPHIAKWYPTADAATDVLALSAGRVVRRHAYPERK